MRPALDRAGVAALVAHHGAMCLLDAALWWDEAAIRCVATSHLDATNPLRRDGRLAAVCGLEYGLQAAALHGALRAGGVRQPAGWLASLRDVALHVQFLDDPGIGTLQIEARAAFTDPAGLIYAIRLADAAGRPLAAARATVVLPK